MIEAIPPSPPASEDQAIARMTVVLGGVEMSREQSLALAQYYFDDGQVAKVEGLELEFAIRKIRENSEDFADFQRGYESNFAQADWEVGLSGN